jgi:hypothetical protein
MGPKGIIGVPGIGPPIGLRYAVASVFTGTVDILKMLARVMVTGPAL